MLVKLKAVMNEVSLLQRNRTLEDSGSDIFQLFTYNTRMYFQVEGFHFSSAMKLFLTGVPDYINIIKLLIVVLAAIRL